MTMRLSRHAIMPAWLLLVSGLFALSASPLTLPAGAFLLFVGIVPPAIVLILSKAPSLTLAEAIAEELHSAQRSAKK